MTGQIQSARLQAQTSRMPAGMAGTGRIAGQFGWRANPAGGRPHSSRQTGPGQKQDFLAEQPPNFTFRVTTEKYTSNDNVTTSEGEKKRDILVNA